MLKYLYTIEPLINVSIKAALDGEFLYLRTPNEDFQPYLAD
jgi:hypothetical protein